MSNLNQQLKLALLKRKKSGNSLEQGFTLVELMVVIVIVGILSGVALPNFLATRDKAGAGALIGSMAAFGKACGGNQVIGDPVALQDIPATMDISNAGVCDGSADITIANANEFTAENIG
ncbi:MAG: type II secretion system protein, partial [Prochlorococcus sp.]